MKKILALILAAMMLVSCIALTACGGEGETTTADNGDGTTTTSNQETTTPGGITEEQWNQMILPLSFENYTLTESGTVISDGEAVNMHVIVKIAGDKVGIRATAFGQTDYLVFEGEEAAEQKKAYEEVFLALLADFKNYTYNAEENVYENPETITVTLEYPSEDVTATVEMSNGKVYLDGAKLVKFECAFVQTTVTPGGTYVSSSDKITWTFADYGTTVVEDEETTESTGNTEETTETTTVDNGGEEKPEGAWNGFLNKLDNYTMTEKATMNYSGFTMDLVSIIKVDTNKISLSIDMQGVETVTYYENVEALEQINGFKAIFGAMLGNFGDYEYSEEENAYISNETYNVHTDYPTQETSSADSEIKNVKVYVDEEGNITKIVCVYSQTTYGDFGKMVTTSDNMTWEFSDFGTTTVEIPAE